MTERKPKKAPILITQIQMVTVPQMEKMISHWIQTKIPIQTEMELETMPIPMTTEMAFLTLTRQVTEQIH